ncbi:MAG: helix-turn-helix domain-containing protein, partial [Streptosporangiaceae bacterium]
PSQSTSQRPKYPGSFGNREGGMTRPPAERLLTVAEAADVLSTTERFPRRLIEQRRIRFVRVGRHVRIPESALREFIQAGQVEPVTTRKRRKTA